MADVADACSEALEKGDHQRPTEVTFQAIMDATALEKDTQEAAARAQMLYREAMKKAKEAIDHCEKAIAIADRAKQDAQAASTRAAQAYNDAKDLNFI